MSDNIRFIQPFRDNTDKGNADSFGGWINVFEYCASGKFLEAFEQNDYLIIQIDTDRSEDLNYNVKKSNAEGVKYTPEELIAKVIEKFQTIFSNAFSGKYNLFKDRIIYAECAEELECWLLPLFYEDKIKRATHNCIHKLNDKINDKMSFYIDRNNKSNQVDNYHKLSKLYLRHKVLSAKYGENISLKIFIESLKSMQIVLE